MMEYFITSALICLCALVAYFKIHEMKRIRQLLKYEQEGIEISNSICSFGSLFKSNSKQEGILSLKLDKEERSNKKLSTSLNNTIEQLSDSVWIKNPSKISLQDLVTRIENYLESKSKGGKLEISFEQNILSSAESISPSMKENIYLVFREAVTNALKHSNGDALKVTLLQTNNLLELRIHDNGVVDPKSVKDLGIGVSNMQLRANILKSDIEINFSKGFLVKLIVRL